MGLVLWFWLFEVFVLLILLNMLLAIIMDHYMELVASVRSMSDAPAIWDQSSNYFSNMRKMKGFYPLIKVLLDLTDANPAHQNEIVTTESLNQAFEHMSLKQAEYMMRFLQKDAIARAAEEMDSDSTARLKEISTLVHDSKHHIDMLTMNISLSQDKLVRLEQKFDALDSRLDTIQASVHECSTELQEVTKTVGKSADPEGMSANELSNTVDELRELVRVCKADCRATSQDEQARSAFGLSFIPSLPAPPLAARGCCAVERK